MTLGAKLRWKAHVKLPDSWLEVSIRKVLRTATSVQVFLGFPVSKSEY